MLGVISVSSIWGDLIKISIFGESHGKAIGCVIDGLPSGISIDTKLINKDLLRRSAKSYELATPRKEADHFEIISGFFNNKTTGTPLCCMIENTDTRSKDYSPEILRPGHADYTAYVRYKGFQDYRGGGHFSGRITAPLVIAGSICKQVLHSIEPEIKFGSRIISIENINDKKTLNWKDYLKLDLSELKYPFINQELIPKVENRIKEVIKEGDSLGGIVECWITGIKAGIGNPFFDSVESELASLLFSIPAVKGVEFGSGFDLTRMKGSQANDSIRIDNGKIYTQTNNNGGINGGITNGMPIIFRVAIKPTPTIKKEQKTINYKLKENIIHQFRGRHDPCIILRVPVVIESISAIALLNLILKNING